ncbi:hypothetical protein Sjap_014404 [Stephania japonica]|uniref:Uncharacterized protein n=1 Tax=Stephania japonica TaxID=461633 RepID=A0AAP0J1U3_9MAGN
MPLFCARYMALMNMKGFKYLVDPPWLQLQSRASEISKAYLHFEITFQSCQHLKYQKLLFLFENLQQPPDFIWELML